ncbi:hypothetical protein KSP40_PGU002919 [Platanthera guangdongensis]|uniref:Uncharacterized protein n=1 Tax=Platanthera guangdongensis TaxID=2320717 RepID=A0ABR2MJ48_9ASPA
MLDLLCSKLLDRIITVEYSARDDDANNRNGHSPNRRGRGSPRDRRGRDRDRGERVIERGSPDYGCGPSPYNKPDSGSNSRSNGAEVGSPDYDRYRRSSNGSPFASPLANIAPSSLCSMTTPALLSTSFSKVSIVLSHPSVSASPPPSESFCHVP